MEYDADVVLNQDIWEISAPIAANIVLSTKYLLHKVINKEQGTVWTRKHSNGMVII